MQNDGIARKSVEDAAKWRLFNETVRKVRDAFRDMSIRELNAIIDEAVANVREKKHRGSEN